ncbi:sensor domain-containing diguanylate cyclase [Allohahella marinimesophila]|uniref:diguanylate cyclase n=1 Tax=Allohahella marinimesophila TaxID=1054972 RepID=A0ABP7NY43_9GAMM
MRNTSLRHVLVSIVAVFTLYAGSVIGAPHSISLPPDALPYNIGGHFEFLIDTEAKLDIDSIQAIPNDEWQEVKATSASFGFSEATYWFRADLQQKAIEQAWILELGYPLLDYVDVYFLQDGRLTEHYQTGDRRPFKQRPIDYRNFLFPLTLGSEEVVSVYVKIQSSSAVQMPLAITTPAALFQNEQTLLGLQGMYFGVIAVMLIYNLFILFSTRDRAYLLYVMLVLAVGGFQLSLHGFAYQFLWPESPWLQDKLTGVFVAMASLFGIWFTISFLNVRYYSRRLFWGLSAIAGVGGLLTLLAPYRYIIQLAAALGFVSVLVALGTGLYIWYRGYKPAVHYSIAFAALLIGTALMILNKFGLLPLNPLTENGQQIGSLAQLVLLSFALAFRIKVLRDETEEAQLEATSRLEVRVKERTRELEQANEKLQQLSNLDPLTGSLNRRYFDEQLVSEWQRATREQTTISLIMLDIDRFKLFNDTYGHQIGDDCLIFLVRHLNAAVLRPTDVVVRYGGEEFAVVLPGTDSEGAETVAGGIKERLAMHPFPIGKEELAITVSQGIATMVPQVDEAPELLIKRADDALYKAKHAGRDCYLIYGNT